MKVPYIPSEHSLKGLKGAPSEWVKRFVSKLPKGGRVLDLACGCGRNTRLLASCGFEVVGADIDERCRPYIEAIPGAVFVQADFEGSPWPFEPKSFDAVLVSFYLERRLYQNLFEVLKDDGYLIYETFMLPYPGFDGNRAKNPDFVLKPLELIDVYRDQMEILAYGQEFGEKGDCFQQFLAQKSLRS